MTNEDIVIALGINEKTAKDILNKYEMMSENYIRIAAHGFRLNKDCDGLMGENLKEFDGSVDIFENIRHGVISIETIKDKYPAWFLEMKVAVSKEFLGAKS